MDDMFKKGDIPSPWEARESATDFNRNPGSDSTTGQGSHVSPPTQSWNNGQLSLYRVGQAIPRIHQGDDVEIAPGDYAAFVFTLPFGKARKDSGL
ncbi:hypothetical protein PENSTE_c023G08548 [Penicillium steckii]|uniref:Uncharacterized protein n=1 Tax=Penicillium steckii TaxID=303698 RepID=A0A1V6SSY1_9EURO|nr:hypothetical protein PENSTE_c023G08548 [Penicillium steckii]